MSVRDVIVSILNSRPREVGGTLEPDVANSRAAIVELQEADIPLAGELDSRE